MAVASRPVETRLPARGSLTAQFATSVSVRRVGKSSQSSHYTDTEPHQVTWRIAMCHMTMPFANVEEELMLLSWANAYNGF